MPSGAGLMSTSPGGPSPPPLPASLRPETSPGVPAASGPLAAERRGGVPRCQMGQLVLSPDPCERKEHANTCTHVKLGPELSHTHTHTLAQDLPSLLSHTHIMHGPHTHARTHTRVPGPSFPHGCRLQLVVGDEPPETSPGPCMPAVASSRGSGCWQAAPCTPSGARRGWPEPEPEPSKASGEERQRADNGLPWERKRGQACCRLINLPPAAHTSLWPAQLFFTARRPTPGRAGSAPSAAEPRCGAGRLSHGLHVRMPGSSPWPCWAGSHAGPLPGETHMASGAGEPQQEAFYGGCWERESPPATTTPALCTGAWQGRVAAAGTCSRLRGSAPGTRTQRCLCQPVSR